MTVTSLSDNANAREGDGTPTASVRPVGARRRWLRTVTVLVVIAAVAALVVWQREQLADLDSVLSRARWPWIGAAIIAQAASIAALARQQQRLIGVSGDRLPMTSVLATTYAGGAISLSLPLVGKVAAAMYTYRRFTASGVRSAVVGWAVAMSAVYSTLAFLGICAAGAIVTGSTDAIVAGALSLALVIVPVAALLAAVRNQAVRRVVGGASDRMIAVTRRVTRRPLTGASLRVRTAIDTVAGLHLGGRTTTVVALWSTTNFIATLVCLLLSILAVGGDIPWHSIILVWAAGAGAAQLGLTPGGLGVVEVALSVALISAGMPASTAVGAVLVYRAISLWLVVAAGGITLLATATTRRGHAGNRVRTRPEHRHVEPAGSAVSRNS